MPLMQGRVLASGVMVPVNVDLDGDLQVDILAALPAGTNLIGDVQARNKGWVSGAWQKDPLRVGYSGIQAEQVSNLSAAAGTNTLLSSVVPAGEIWNVQEITALDINTNPTAIYLGLQIGGVDYYLLYLATPGAAIPVNWSGSIIVAPGSYVKAAITGCTLNDDIYLRYSAVRIDTDQ